MGDHGNSKMALGAQLTCLLLGLGGVLLCANAQSTNQVLRIAFSAGLTSTVNVTDHVNVTYDRVWLNNGDAYDASSGVFTVPYDGAYMFIFHALAEYDGYLWLDLYKNSEYQAAAYAHVTGEYGSASNAVVLELKKDDIVYVTGHGTSTLTEISEKSTPHSPDI